MAYLNVSTLDAALEHIRSTSSRFYICSALPTTYSEASRLPTETPSGFRLGWFPGPLFWTFVEDATQISDGRQTRLAGFTSPFGADRAGTATHWAITGDGELLAAGELASNLPLDEGETWGLAHELYILAAGV